MSGAALPIPRPWSRPLQCTVPASWLLALLVGGLGVDQLLLWRFLDAMPLWAYGAGALAIAFLCRATVRSVAAEQRVPIGTLLCCIGVAALLLLLSGEGRFFYANIDWQVRFAVLRDLQSNPWPFVYPGADGGLLLRAPIAMFLLPAVIGKAAGPAAADIALLVQNALLIGTMLALGSMLFDGRRARWIALALFLVFSGLDAIGRLLVHGSLSDHLEHWAYLQFSSTITLLFWVPQHALAGWVGALGFLLWRSGRIALAPWLTLMPLAALWSPLGLAGGLPFVALAGLRSLLSRSLRPADILLPALATLLSIPSLLYLSAGAGDGVGLHIVPLPPAQWGLFELLEVGIYALPLLFAAPAGRFGRDSLLLAILCLLAAPFIQVGWSIDFMMRASICALAILAVLTAEALLTVPRLRVWLAVVLLAGSVTGWHEITRALLHPAAPAVRCNLVTAWDFQALELGMRVAGDPPSPKGTYLAPLGGLPRIIRPAHPAPVRADPPGHCWDGHWYHPNEAGILAERRASAH